MARAPRRYRAPLVITIAAALGPACGPEYVLNPPDPPGGGDGDGDVEIGLGGDKGSGGRFTTTNPPFPYPECSRYGNLEENQCSPGFGCVREMDCTSGEPRRFLYECDATGKASIFHGEIECIEEDCKEADTACDLPYEACLGDGSRTMCRGEHWTHQDGIGGNPPAPCPTEAPELGTSCNAGVDFGADQEHCGYPCGEDWTVIGCVPESDSEPEDPNLYRPGQWEGDGVCGLGPGGAGGVGGATP